MPEHLGTYSFPLPNGERCPTGTFTLHLETSVCDWSDGLFGIHGYTRGEVVPTLELVMAHKHPDDLDAARNMIDEVRRHGSLTAIFHRILDSKGRERRALTVAEGDRDESGNVSTIHGLTIDLTRALALESRHAATSALVNAYGSRAIIEQAKGILMGYFNVGSVEAFSLLALQSQHTNTKAAAIAMALVAAAEAGRIQSILRQWESLPRTRQRNGANDSDGATNSYHQI
jgi:hypothetical protein